MQTLGQATEQVAGLFWLGLSYLPRGSEVKTLKIAIAEPLTNAMIETHVSVSGSVSVATRAILAKVSKIAVQSVRDVYHFFILFFLFIF